MSLVEELIKNFEHLIDSVSLIPSDGGRFEVSVNDKIIFSKLEQHRHAEVDEIINIIFKMVEG